MQSSLSNEAHYLKVLNQFAVNLLHQNTIDDIVWSIAKDAIAKLDFVDCVIYLKEGNYLIQKAAHGDKNPEEYNIFNPILIPLGQGIVGTVAQSGKSEMISDTSKDNRYIVDDEYRYSELTVPIIAEGKVLGVIDSEHPTKNFYTHKHLEILTTIAALAATKILQARAQKKLKDYNKNLEAEVTKRTGQLQTTLQELKDVNETLQKFAYTVSHDLRQPLRMVTSYVQLLKKRYSHLLDDAGGTFIDYAYKGGIRAQELVDNILKYSRVGINKATDIVPIDLNEIIENVELNLKLDIIQSEATLSYQKLPTVNGVETLYIQLFQNIIDNAIKFRSEKAPLIRINAREEEDFYIISIQDNGRGISPDFHERVFEIFGKEGMNNRENVGLGLAISKKIVHILHGKIWVESEVGKGSTFYVALRK